MDFHVINGETGEELDREGIEKLEKEYNEHQRKTREMILHELNTQNNQGTAYPMYCVIEIVNYEPTSDTDERIREIFFTNKEAMQYIEEYAHEHAGELFIYVKSGYRNDGWKLARELMKGNTSDK